MGKSSGAYGLGAVTNTERIDQGHAQGLFGRVERQNQVFCNQGNFLIIISF